jgi:hypothetical protein
MMSACSAARFVAFAVQAAGGTRQSGIGFCFLSLPCMSFSDDKACHLRMAAADTKGHGALHCRFFHIKHDNAVSLHAL